MESFVFIIKGLKAQRHSGAEAQRLVNRELMVKQYD